MTERSLTPRAGELDTLFGWVVAADCCAVVGLSNMGKSALLRSFRPETLLELGHRQADEFCLIYIDLNLMVDMTEQAFYELTLRSIRTALLRSNASGQVRERINEAYSKVVDSSNPFLVPLGFNEGIVALCEHWHKRIAILFDEFDGPFRQIDARVYLNLRALKDRYSSQLCYIVATGRRLEKMRRGSEIDEFCEMFAHQVLWLGPLNCEDAQQAVVRSLEQEDVLATDRDIAVCWQMTGGHPGLIQAVCHVLARSGGAAPQDDFRLARERLDSDPTVRDECAKLWNGLGEEEQDLLIDFCSGSTPDARSLSPLLRSGILVQIEKDVAFKSTLFGGFVRRQRLIKSPFPPGVRVDVDSGEVWVNGRRVPTLTELEYRLLLLLYGRIGKICDKYQIVESVWGEDYIDQVDDARIEKLVSRLRKKVEPDPNAPHYLLTVRGRGYRLVEG